MCILIFGRILAPKCHERLHNYFFFLGAHLGHALDSGVLIRDSGRREPVGSAVTRGKDPLLLFLYTVSSHLSNNLFELSNLMCLTFFFE